MLKLQILDAFLKNPNDPDFFKSWKPKIDAYFSTPSKKKELKDPSRLNSKNFFVSNLRTSMMEYNIRDPGYEPYIAQLRKKFGNEPVDTFANLSLKEQYKYILKLRKEDIEDDDYKLQDDDLNIYLKNCPLLPASCENFMLSDKEFKKLDAIMRKRKNIRMKEPAIEVDAQMILELIKEGLESKEEGRLVSALLLACGRRGYSELLNPETNFTFIEGKPHVIGFDNQKKLRYDAAEMYEIPLVGCDSKTFIAARERWIKDFALPGWKDMDDLTLKNRYNMKAKKWTQDYLKDAIHGHYNVHFLRAIYAVLSEKLYNQISRGTLNPSAYMSKILGHADSSTSVYYNKIKIV